MNNEEKKDRFFITKDEFLKNIDEFKKAVNEGLKDLNDFKITLYVNKRESKKDDSKSVDLYYATWSDILIWMKLRYPNHVFTVKQITLDDVVCQLYINGDLQMETLLSAETFSKSNTKETKEKIVQRVYVKLVAMVTGFGIELWNDRYFAYNNQPKKTTSTTTNKKKISFEEMI